MRLPIFLFLTVACSGKDNAQTSVTDTAGNTVVDGCDPEADPSLVIGQGAGAEFFALDEGAEVGLDVAPQGGFGVSVRATTTGLVADNPVDVLLEVEYNGENVGSFVNEGSTLYCQDDGTGLLWGVVVGFDRFQFPNNDDLINFDRERVTLVVGITDVDSDYAEGRVEVIVEVSG